MKLDNLFLIGGVGVLAYFLLTSKQRQDARTDRVEIRNETFREIFKGESNVFSNTKDTFNTLSAFDKSQAGQTFKDLSLINLMNPLNAISTAKNLTNAIKKSNNVSTPVKLTPSASAQLQVLSTPIIKATPSIFKTTTPTLKYVGNISTTPSLLSNLNKTVVRSI